MKIKLLITILFAGLISACGATLRAFDHTITVNNQETLYIVKILPHTSHRFNWATVIQGRISNNNQVIPGKRILGTPERIQAKDGYVIFKMTSSLKNNDALIFANFGEDIIPGKAFSSGLGGYGVCPYKSVLSSTTRSPGIVYLGDIEMRFNHGKFSHQRYDNKSSAESFIKKNLPHLSSQEITSGNLILLPVNHDCSKIISI